MPYAASRSGFSVTAISRSTPPTRFTWPTPGMVRSVFEMSLSTNQESSVAVLPLALTV